MSRQASLVGSQPTKTGRRRAHVRMPWSRRPHGRSDSADVLQALDGAVVVRDRDGLITSWNSGAEQLYGYSANEAVGQAFDFLLPAGQRDWEAEVANATLLAGLSDSYRSERLSRSGETRAVAVHSSPMRDRAGEIVGVATVEHELLERRCEQHPAPSIDTPFRDAFESAPIGIALVALEPGSAGRLLRANRALCELTGYSREHLESTDVGALVHPEDVATDLAAMAALHAAEIQSFELEQRLLHAERHAVWVSVNVALVRDASGKPLYCIRHIQDIEERKRYEGELGYLVEHDPLTGLLNRRGFLRELTHELAYTRRYGGGGTVLFIDLDDFKRVNDTLGHSVGDQVISDVARIASERLRETDIFARLGGDEFALLLPHTSVPEAEALAASLIETVQQACGLALSESRGISMSIGIKSFSRPDKDLAADDLLVDADHAMYLAKDAGKARVAVATDASLEHIKSRVTWAERVRQAVMNSSFQVFCQPIVDFANDGVSQWELLLRLPGDCGELILPSQFLYTAERSGLIVEIDRWMVHEALRLIAEQRTLGNEVRLEVNISGRSVGDPELLTIIEDGLEALQIDPSSLVIEVTETAAIANMDRARGFAAGLQALGCRFALDDFGAGFGSFYYLKHIPFDYVKIDGEFIRNLPESSTDQLILDSIVQMSTGLGKLTIAEFVESQETVEVLKQHGVDYGQGFHLGKPRPVLAALGV